MNGLACMRYTHFVFAIWKPFVRMVCKFWNEIHYTFGWVWVGAVRIVFVICHCPHPVTCWMNYAIILHIQYTHSTQQTHSIVVFYLHLHLWIVFVFFFVFIDSKNLFGFLLHSYGWARGEDIPSWYGFSVYYSHFCCGYFLYTVNNRDKLCICGVVEDGWRMRKRITHWCSIVGGETRYELIWHLFWLLWRWTSSFFLSIALHWQPFVGHESWNPPLLRDLPIIRQESQGLELDEVILRSDMWSTSATKAQFELYH